MCGCHSDAAIVRLTVEPLPILVVDGKGRRKHLQRVTARQPRVLGQVDDAHPPGAELTQDRVASVGLAISQRHMWILQVSVHK